MRKLAFCICENIDSDQPFFGYTKKYNPSTISKLSSLYLSSMVVQPGFCQPKDSFSHDMALSSSKTR